MCVCVTPQVKLVLKRNHFMVETSDPHVFNVLWKDSVISEARLSDEGKDLVPQRIFGTTTHDHVVGLETAPSPLGSRPLA